MPFERGQIVFGLLCTADGFPVAVEVFEGSTSDPKTVAAQVDKIRGRFGLKRWCWSATAACSPGRASAKTCRASTGCAGSRPCARPPSASSSPPDTWRRVDLKVRPIYHRRPDRVRAHVLLCMLAYYVEWHMRSKLAPVLFDDHDPEGWRAAAAFGGAAGAALAGGAGEGVQQAHRRRSAGAQLPQPDQRVGDADDEHDAGDRGRRYLSAHDPADGAAAALLRATWRLAPDVGTEGICAMLLIACIQMPYGTLSLELRVRANTVALRF